MNDIRPSLLIISHTYAIDEHAKKLAALNAHFEVLCVTVTHEDSGLPPRHEDASTSQAPDFRLRLPILGKVSWNRFIYRGLWAVFRQRHWDYVLVEAEPWLPVKWQSFLLARLSGNVGRYGEFTWENLRRPGLKGWILEPVYRLSACWLDFWIAGNVAAGQILRESGMEASRVLVCTQVGVDVDHAPVRSEETRRALCLKHGIPPEAFVAGFAGRLVKEKGIRDLVAAVRQLRAEGGMSRDVHVALMGGGRLRDELEKISQAEPWLHVLPKVSHEQVAGHLQIMDLLVLGSHPYHEDGNCWEEQFGHILVEAMACGVAVAGSDSGAIPEVIGDPAMIFPVGDVPALAGLVRRCCKEPSFFEERQQAQSRRVREQYTHEKVAQIHADFLKSL